MQVRLTVAAFLLAGSSAYAADPNYRVEGGMDSGGNWGIHATVGSEPETTAPMPREKRHDYEREVEYSDGYGHPDKQVHNEHRGMDEEDRRHREEAFREKLKKRDEMLREKRKKQEEFEREHRKKHEEQKREKQSHRDEHRKNNHH